MAAIGLPLQKMTFSQKMEAMELLWDSLSRNNADFDSPAWHQPILDEREGLVKSGKARFSSWPEAKARIRKRVRED